MKRASSGDSAMQLSLSFSSFHHMLIVGLASVILCRATTFSSLGLPKTFPCMACCVVRVCSIFQVVKFLSTRLKLNVTSFLDNGHTHNHMRMPKQARRGVSMRLKALVFSFRV